MAYRSSLNLSSINKSLKSLSANISDARKSAQNVGQTILDTNRQKRKAISRNSSLFRRRREAARRKEREDIVEASTITGAVNRTKTAVVNSSKGFLGRILDFLGTLLVGWAIINLPNIIKMAENLMKRMKEYFLVLEDFKSGLQEFLITFGDTVGQVTSSISNFDFISTARIMRTQMGKMKTSFERMENSLNRALTMLRQDAYKILGIDPPEEETTESEGSENEGRTSGQVKGSGTRTGTREERAMLDAIAFAEGTRDQVDNGYRTHYGFSTFDDYSKHPDKPITAGKYTSTAAGRYQFLTTTWNGYAKKLGLKDFSPMNQDLAAIAYAKDLGVTQALLKKEGMSAEVSRRLGRAWAAMAGSNLGQGTKSLASIQKAYEASLGAQPKQANTPPPAPLPQNKNGIVYLPGGKYALFGGQRYSVDPNNPEDLLYPEDGRTTPSQNELDYASKQAQKASNVKQTPVSEPKNLPTKTNRKASDPFFDPRTGGTLKPGMKVDVKKSYASEIAMARKKRPTNVVIIKEKEFINKPVPLPSGTPMENVLNNGTVAMVNNTNRALNGIG